MRDHYAPSQFRTEAWNMLRQATTSLYRRHEAGKETDALVDEVRWILERLGQIERYWAFPGRSVCEELTRRLDDQHFETLADRASHVTRLLVSHAYRSRDLTGGQAESPDGVETQGVEAPSETPSHGQRHYFEVLVVDEGDGDEERRIRDALHAVQAADDDLVYDVVVVPSFEDAVIAVLFNHNLQSCVIRYAFPVASRRPVPELQHYLGLVAPDLFERAETDPAGALA
ncbi:MAG TPA: hypothetical protein VML54_09800, partial [Candidatus Limnocylindrales bacterium]|nr:hypothetical protein [Candidatus Limnocylindrales bacterium]